MKETLINDTLFRHAFFVALIIGTLCRFFVLQVKDKQYPSMPQDYLEQIIVAGLASSLGAIALPALIDKEFSALTFLAVGIQQFQGLSNQEKITLENIDADDLVTKGNALINDISITYEVRSYVSLFSSLVSSIIYIFFAKRYTSPFWVCTIFAALGGMIVGLIFRKILKRNHIRDIADIYPAEIKFDGPILKVNNIVMDNIGLTETRKKYLEKAIAIEIVAKDMKKFGILCDLGQQEAIMHNIYVHLGVYKDADELDIKEKTRIDFTRKSIVMLMVPLYKNEMKFIKAAENAFVLDTSKRRLSAYKKKGFDY